MQNIMVLGSSGSVGSSFLNLIASMSEKFCVKTLVSGSNAKKLAQQAIQHQAANVIIADDSKYRELKTLLSGSGTRNIAAGAQAVLDATKEDHDITVAAIVGIAGLEPIAACIPCTKRLVLANKESLICGGEIIKKLIAQHNTELVPLDSEHNAIFQILNPAHRAQLSKITLTASGGPFRNKSLAEMAVLTPQQAVKHPNWAMGAKISIDSATLMNKGLEVIETAILFDCMLAEIEVLIHPESIIHSLVHYKDGSTLAHLGMPDMRVPISFALSYPERIAWESPKLDLLSVAQLNFSQPDHERFPLLQTARNCYAEGQAACIILNAANEFAVNCFLQKKIGFLEINQIVQYALETTVRLRTIDSVEEIIALNDQVFEHLSSKIPGF